MAARNCLSVRPAEGLASSSASRRFASATRPSASARTGGRVDSNRVTNAALGLRQLASLKLDFLQAGHAEKVVSGMADQRRNLGVVDGSCVKSRGLTSWSGPVIDAGQARLRQLGA